MYVNVAADGALSLQDTDNLRAFSVREQVPGSAAAALASIATAAEDGHFWLDAEAVLALSSRETDADWVAAYWQMLASVAAYGYYDESAGRVKAHVEAANDQN